MQAQHSRQIILFLGSMGYVGYVPVASGTVTVALFGVPLFYLVHDWHVVNQALLAVAFSLLAVMLSGWGERILQEKDSPKLVVDEIAGYLVAVCALPWSWKTVLLSFVLERAFDITKIPPANWIERRVPGGWGIVLDDIVAGAYTLIIMHVLLALAPQWLV